jgi:hypothetical protein
MDKALELVENEWRRRAERQSAIVEEAIQELGGLAQKIGSDQKMTDLDNLRLVAILYLLSKATLRPVIADEWVSGVPTDLRAGLSRIMKERHGIDL